MSEQDPPQQRPLDGWEVLADVVSDTAPGIAEFMVLLSSLARVTAEGQLDGLVEMAASQFGMSPQMYRALQNSLADSAFPLSAGVLVDMLVAAGARLSPEERAFMEAPNGLADAVAALFRQSPRMGDYAELDELHGRLADYVTALHADADVILEASCSIEVPGVLGAVPIDCARLANRVWPNDLLGVGELSYGRSLRETFTGRVHAPGPVGGSGLNGGIPVTIDKKHRNGYDPGINDLRVKDFYRNWTQPGVNSWVYTLHVTDGYLQWANNVAARQLEAHRDEITSKVHEKATQAATEIAEDVAPRLQEALGVAAITANNMLHPLVPLAAAAAAAVVGMVVDKVVSILASKQLTTWSIGHTVVTDSRMVPLSIFTLSRSGDVTKLCKLATGNAGEPTLSRDYANSDVEERARFMLGTTVLNEMSAPRFDPSYFALVAEAGEPLAWHDPHKVRGGFRVLLPHSRPGSKAMYVSAVCADVRYGSIG